MNKLKVLIIGVSSLVLMSGALAPAHTAAFSAYGAGTLDNPYRVATCAQLQEMKDNLAGHYKLVSNIDCSGFSFTSVGTMSPSAPFTGSLNGDNHTISNLNSTDSGIFKYTSGASISNIKIASGTVTGNGNQGSFIGYSVNSTLSNVHSSMTVAVINPASAAYIGGLVGGSTGATVIDGSSYSGTVAGGAYVGGLIGYMGDISTPTADVLSNSFFNGTINQTDSYGGGAVGILYSGTVRNVYSSGTLNITGGGNHRGGLIGVSYRGASNNNFSATYITGNASYSGGMYADFFVTSGGWNSTRLNNYYDRYRINGNDAYSRNCSAVDEGTGNCTAVNTANATPSYFKNNSTNPPLNHASWDFTNTWQVTSEYPTLKKLSNFIDPAVPNNGDANGDGTLDSYQAHVASVQNTSSTWSTVEAPNTANCTITNPQAVDSNSLKVDSSTTPQTSTMTAFDVYCPTPGLSVPVTIVYDKQYDTKNLVLRHYNPVTKSYSTVAGAIFNTRTVGGVVKSTVTYTITDGGVLDTDGLANGVIKDPVGLALVPGPPNTGVNAHSSASSTLILVTGLLSLILVASRLRLAYFKEK